MSLMCPPPLLKLVLSNYKHWKRVDYHLSVLNPRVLRLSITCSQGVLRSITVINTFHCNLRLAPQHPKAWAVALTPLSRCQVYQDLTRLRRSISRALRCCTAKRRPIYPGRHQHQPLEIRVWIILPLKELWRIRHHSLATRRTLLSK